MSYEGVMRNEGTVMHGGKEPGGAWRGNTLYKASVGPLLLEARRRRDAWNQRCLTLQARHGNSSSGGTVSSRTSARVSSTHSGAARAAQLHRDRLEEHSRSSSGTPGAQRSPRSRHRSPARRENPANAGSVSVLLWTGGRAV